MTDERDMFIALSMAAAAHADQDVLECRMWLEVALDCCLSWTCINDDESADDAKWSLFATQLRRQGSAATGAEIIPFPALAINHRYNSRLQSKSPGAVICSVVDYPRETRG